MKTRLVIIILVLLLGGGGIWYFFLRKEERPLVLQTEEPKYGYISKSVTATGTVEPVDTVAVGSQVSGTINVASGGAGGADGSISIDGVFEQLTNGALTLE